MLLVWLAMLSAWNQADAQITVTVANPTNTTPNLAASYTSFAAALTDLNNVTAMTGPVTLTLTGGQSETAPAASGFVLGSATLNPVLSATNTITIIKSVGINPVILNAAVGVSTPSSATPDGILSVRGADFVTINGLTFTDGNTTNPATMEFGVGFFKTSVTDGCNNNIVQNCIFNMQRINNATGSTPMVEGSVAINVVNALATASSTSLTPTATSGSNSNNFFLNNTINGGNYGIVVNGFAPSAAPFNFADNNNTIGGIGAGNTINNFGGAIGATNPAAGIRVNNQAGVSIAFNVINNNNGSGANHVSTLRGIFVQNSLGVGTTFNVNNNTITLSSGGTTSLLAGINTDVSLTTGVVVNTLTVIDNIITLSHTTATTAVINGIINGTGSSTTNTTLLNITGNTIQGGGTPWTGTGTLVMIETGSPATATTNNNTVQNISRSSTAGGSFRGIKTTSPTNWNCSGNTVNNINYTNTASSGGLDGIYSLNAAANVTIVGNTISNLVTAGGTINGIREFGGTGTKIISNNQVFNISTLTGGAGGVTYTGIFCSAGTITISRNKVHSISVAGTFGTATGINVSNGVTPANVNNNVIGNLSAPVSTGTNAVRGMDFSTGATCNVYYNTIYLNATSTSTTTFGTSCITFSTTPASLDLRNNILINLSTPAQEGLNTASNGQSVCLRRSSGSAGLVPTNYATTSNNNIFWSNPTAGTNNHLVYAEGTGTLTNPQNTLIQMQAFMGNRDQGSFQENVTFVSTTGSSSNFLQPIGATQAESNAGVVGGLTDAYNGLGIRTGYPLGGQVNGGGTAPDIGAYEGDYTPLDATAPAISFTPLINICTAGVRTLTATITDVSGVPTSGAGLPVLYWRINAGAYQAATGVSLGGNQYQFSLGTGSVTGDVISYYIVAQDNASTPNVGANPSVGASGFTTNPPAVTTPPTTPSSYTNLPTLSAGTYTVGATGTYPTLTAAINAYNNSCIGGAVVFSLIDATYPSETFPITINANVGASSTNTLTIKPATGVSPIISGSSATAIIILNGADFVTINGSNGSVVNSLCPATVASRDLTIQNTNTSTTSAVLSVQSIGTDGANNNELSNINVVGNTNITTLVGINLSGPSIGSGAGSNGNNNNRIINNRITRTTFGIFAAGSSTTVRTTNGTIQQNIMDGDIGGSNNLGRIGIMVLFGDGYSIQGNVIKNINNNASADNIGIIVGNNNLANTLPLAGETINTTISNNIIDNIANTATFSAGGIVIGITNSGTTTIANNMISNVYANGTSPDFGAGIFIAGGTATTNVLHNSVTMSTSAALTGGTFPNVALGISGTNPIVNVRNNILVANGPGNGSTTRSNVAIGLHYAAPFTNLTSNNNLLFAGGTGGSAVGITGTISDVGTLSTTLANWQTTATQDAASQNFAPVFVSTTNLHLQAPNATNTPLFTGGATTSITTDIDCQTRNATTPTIGADETSGCPTITLTPVAGALTAGTIGSAYSVTISQTGLSGTPAWSISAGTLPGGLSINGTSGAITGTPTATGTFNFTVQVTDGTCSQTQAYSIVVSCPTITFVNTTASNATIGTAYSLDASVTGNTQAITYSVSPALPAGLSLNTSTGAITGTPTVIAASATYTVTASQSSGACTVTQNYTFAVVCPTIAITPVAGALSAGTIGTAYSQTISQTGLSGTPAWSISAGALPGGLSINGTSGAITGTPTATGTFNFTVQVTDGTCTQTQAYSIVVSCPTITFTNTVAPNGTVGSAYSFDASVTGNTATITYSVSPALPAGLSLNTSTGQITGTPTAQVAATAYTVTASQSSGVCTATQIYTFSVNCAGITLTPVAGALTAGTIGSAYSVTISQTGLAGTPLWSISAGALPGGLSINATSGEVSGTPTSTGTFNFTVQVTDGTCTASQAYSIVVSCPTIVFVNASATNATIGTAYSLDASVTGNTQAITYSVSPALPTGLTLNTSTGQITGTPTATAASATYTVTASQGSGVCTATQNYTFAVVCPTITFTNTIASNATVGVAYNLNAGVTGNTATVTYSVSPALPAGLSLNTSTGQITGTPTATVASTTYTVTASQSSGVCTATQNYTFAVNCAGVSISPTTLPNGVLSAVYSQTLTQTGLSGTPAWSVSTGALPTGLSLNGTSGVISGTPSALGTFNFTVQVTDGTCSTSQAYTVVISCTGVSVNPATLPNATQLAAYSQTLTQTGLSGTVTWSVSAGTLPTGLTLNTTSGVISGTPSTLGTFNFTVQATDGTCSATRAYTVVVAASGPIIEISVTDIDFGDVLILQSSRKTITVRNIGAAPLSLSSMSMPNVVFNYGFIGTTPILPNESREFEVSFTPIAVASYSGTVTVNSNAVGGVNTFTVRGNGINPTALNTDKDVVLKAYPNPTANQVNISVENAWIGEYNVSVKDVLGKEVMSQKSNTSAFQVDLTSLPSGLYLIQVSHKNGTKTIQIAKK
jgi:hypothetical protein